MLTTNDRTLLIDSVTDALHTEVVRHTVRGEIDIEVFSEGKSFERALATALVDGGLVGPSQARLKTLQTGVKNLRRSLPSGGYIGVGYIRGQLAELLHHTTE